MNGDLTGLTEADISARCTEASFGRGWNYYTGGAVRLRMRTDDGLETRVAGTHTYRVTVRERSGGLVAFCTCPYDWGGECKHIVATMLAWLHEPESFRAAADLRSALEIRGKDELIDILADICAIYPHLVDEFGLLGKPGAFDPQTIVDEIFDAIEPPGEISVEEAVARMEGVARRAARLTRQGQGEVSRHACYLLTQRCVDFCEDYGAHDIFPVNIPYDFAVAYRDLALEQLEEHANAIEGEVRRMLRGDWAPEMLGIDEPLMEVEAALGL